jgi:membrane-bound lytic murein transglycosylase F
MFQEIALQYDLDWRLLAAQAYVETGLDALALGNDGDMGLMQVLPSTWREWAPTVGAVDPFDAYSNTLVASAYLDYVRGELGKRGYPQAQWMLVGYNWGPDRLINFLEGGGTFEQLPAVRSQYATDIMRIARTIP